ncbi:hypothetical protein CHUAL_010749 [Chamberlinius hualienensis]
MENQIHAIIHHIDGKSVEFVEYGEILEYLKHQNEAVFLEIQIDKDENLSVYEQHFQNIVDKIIVQCTVSESKTFIYYKHFQNGFVKVDLDTECSTEICQIYEEISEQTITFDVIVKGIKIKLFGEFEDTNKSLLTVKFNPLHHLVLIYLSAKNIIYDLLKLSNVEIGNKPSLSVNYNGYTNLERSFQIDNQNKSLILTEIELAERFNEFPFVLISGKAGMGKSTVLMDTLVHEFTKNNLKNFTNLWYIKIDLVLYKSCFKEMKSCHTVEKFVNFFVDKLLAFEKETRLKTEFERKLLKHFLQNKQNVILMFDGFDEISPNYQNVVIDLLLTLKSTKVRQIWITTRSHMTNDLEKKFNIKSVKLLKISEQNQINLMTEYWIKQGTDSDRLQLFAKILIKNFSKLIEDPRLEFTGIPLQTRMLADAFTDKASEFSSSNKIELELGENLFQLYDKFFKIKFAIRNGDNTHSKKYMDIPSIEHNVAMKNIEISSLENSLIEISAILTIFPTDYIKLLPDAKDTTFIEGLVKQRKNIGLISEVVNNQPVFIHKSYTEYFTAKYLINSVFINENQNEDFINLILPDLFHQIQYSIVLQFLNGFIGQLKVDQVKFLMKNLEKYINLEIKIKNKMYEQTILQIAAKKNLKHWVWVIFNSFDCFFKQTNFINLHETKINDLCNTDYETTIRLFGSQLKAHDSDKNKFLKYISHQDEEYNTVLHITVAYGHLSMVKLIINHCMFIDIDVRSLVNGDKLGNNKLLLFAVDKNKMDIVQYFVDELNIDVKVVSHHNYNFTNSCTPNPFGSNDFTALHLAAVNNNKPMVDYLLNKYKINDDECSDDLWSPLQAVAMYGQLDMFKYLIQNGENPNEILKTKVNALHFASLNKEMDIFDYLVKNCDLNVDGKGCFCSPLHIMAEYGHIDKIDHCIERYGANINEKSMDGRNALHFAAENGQLDTVNYLITKHKIPINSTCNDGKTVLYYVVETSRMNKFKKHSLIDYLVKNGGKLNESDSFDDVPLNLSELYENAELSLNNCCKTSKWITIQLFASTKYVVTQADHGITYKIEIFNDSIYWDVN